jgi:hypothetical protein
VPEAVQQKIRSEALRTGGEFLRHVGMTAARMHRRRHKQVL